MKRLEQILEDFGNALRRLAEALSQSKTELEIDGTIQRFEFTFELFWKLLKIYLEIQGILCRSPRACLKEAYRIGIIEDEETVLKMMDDRNLSVHIYDQQTSREIFERIQERYQHIFENVFHLIRNSDYDFS